MSMENMSLELRKDCFPCRFQAPLCRDNDHCEVSVVDKGTCL